MAITMQLRKRDLEEFPIEILKLGKRVDQGGDLIKGLKVLAKKVRKEEVGSKEYNLLYQTLYEFFDDVNVFLSRVSIARDNFHPLDPSSISIQERGISKIEKGLVDIHNLLERILSDLKKGDKRNIEKGIDSLYGLLNLSRKNSESIIEDAGRIIPNAKEIVEEEVRIVNNKLGIRPRKASSSLAIGLIMGAVAFLSGCIGAPEGVRGRSATVREAKPDWVLRYEKGEKVWEEKGKLRAVGMASGFNIGLIMKGAEARARRKISAYKGKKLIKMVGYLGRYKEGKKIFVLMGER